MNIGKLPILGLLLIGSFLIIGAMGCGEGDGENNDDGGLPTVCEGECRAHDLSVQIGGEEEKIERAVYGLTAPEQAESGEWELYIQGIHGGFDGCPEYESPTPDWELVLVGLPAKLEPQTYSKEEDGIHGVFFDYLDQMTEELALPAAEVAVTPVAAKVALEMTGEDDKEGFVVLDLELVFAEETDRISGRLVATHCASMDE